MKTKKPKTIRKRLKQNHLGSLPTIDTISPDELLKLHQNIPARDIAHILDTKIINVIKKIELIESIKLVIEEKKKDKIFNNTMKKEIWQPELIDKIAKSLTHFIFRNGPVEKIHAGPDSRLSDQDMEIINKYMVNHLAYILKLLFEDRWMEFFFAATMYENFGRNWDKPNTREVEEEIIDLMILDYLRKQKRYIDMQ